MIKNFQESDFIDAFQDLPIYIGNDQSGEMIFKREYSNGLSLTTYLDIYGEKIELTLREFELLKFLCGAKGQVFSREALMEKVWGYDYYGDVRTVDVTVRRLREKLEDDPSKPVYVLTKRGVGYYFGG